MAVSSIYPVPIDYPELAVRLGSPVTFDRRGNVIYLDSFEDGLGKWQVYTGLGGHPERAILSSATARTGLNSIRLTTADVHDSAVNMTKYLQFPTLSNMGFEFSFSRERTLAAGNNIYLVLFICVYSGSKRYEVNLKWLSGIVPVPGTFYYAGPDWVEYQLFPSLDIQDNLRLFNTFKLVCNFVDNKYIRFIANNVLYNFDKVSTPNGIFVVNDNTTPHMYVSLHLRNAADATAPICYIDDVIITQNEPANPLK